MSESTGKYTAERKHDGAAIRQLITGEIKRSGKSREEIAGDMTVLLSIPVTARMISSFTAGSKELHRWPAEFDIAFCEAIGSYQLLQERVKRAGFQMTGPNEQRLISLGKAWEDKMRAEAILAAAIR